MILLAHMLFGAAIGSVVNNTGVAIALAFLGHYFLDFFPHVEYLENVEGTIGELKGKNRQKNIVNMIKVFLDFSLSLTLIFILSKNTPLIYICALVAVVPDGLTILHALFPNLGLKLHHQIHGGAIHYLTRQKKFPMPVKIVTQVIIIIISIALLRM